MSTINIQCVDQVLTITNSPVITSGDIAADQIVVDFCSLWTGFTKTAVFWRDEGHVYRVVMSNDTATIPYEVLTTEGSLYFGIFGVNDNEVQRTTQVLKYKIQKGAITEGTILPDPTPDIYTQLLAKYAEAMNGIDALDTDKADKVSNATSGNFAGLDANGNLTDSGKNDNSYQKPTNTLNAMTAVDDGDYFPLYDTSGSKHNKTLWSNIKSLLKSYFDTIYTTTSAVATQISTALTSYVPNTRKVNNKSLSSDITLTASDVGAIGQEAIDAKMDKTGGTFSGNVTMGTGTDITLASGGTVENVKTTANAAMPKSGGTFTGDVVAYSENRTTLSLRNAIVYDSATGTVPQSTDAILFRRK